MDLINLYVFIPMCDQMSHMIQKYLYSQAVNIKLTEVPPIDKFLI